MLLHLGATWQRIYKEVNPMLNRISILMATLVMLTACAAPDVTLVTKEPTFDKYGTPTACEDGYQLSVEGQYANMCIPDEQGCPEGYYSDNETGICQPYYESDGSDQTDRPQTSETSNGGGSITQGQVEVFSSAIGG
jgi:hypothetical protein